MNCVLYWLELICELCGAVYWLELMCGLCGAVYWLELMCGRCCVLVGTDVWTVWCGVLVGIDVWTVCCTVCNSTSIIIISNCYGVPMTQLTIFVLLCSCNNITLNMAAIPTEIY